MVFKLYFTLQLTNLWLYFWYYTRLHVHSNVAAAKLKILAEKLLLFHNKDIKKKRDERRFKVQSFASKTGLLCQSLHINILLYLVPRQRGAETFHSKAVQF